MLQRPVRRATALLAATFTLALLAPSARAQLAIGDAMPMADVKLTNVDGKELTLASLAGKKGTLVVFTCNSCPWVKLWEARVAEIGNAALAQGVGVVAINSNDPTVQREDGLAEMKKRAKSLKLAYPYVVDATSDVARAFGATRTPEAFLFAPDGKLVYHGTVDDNAKDASAVKSAWLRDAVNAVVAGSAVTVAETKAFGCTIKFRGKSAKAAS